MFAEFSRGDLVWFDPGIGYVLPGEVLEYHRTAQVLYSIYKDNNSLIERWIVTQNEVGREVDCNWASVWMAIESYFLFELVVSLYNSLFRFRYSYS